MSKFEYEIMSGIYPRHIEKYFSDICISNDDNSTFNGDDWKVVLIYHQDKKYKSISLPSTSIIFSGNEVTCLDLIHRYRMKFLSAGG